MKWLKENWFRLGLLLAILIAGLSVAYYYLVFLPQESRNNTEQAASSELLSIKADFMKTCENKYEDLYNESVSSPSLLKVMVELTKKNCAEGSHYDRTESLWYCADKISYVQSRNDFIDYCVAKRMSQLAQ